MQDHRYSFEIDATPEELWRMFWGRKKGDVTEHGDVRIEILHAGDESGEGLIRHCHFRVPRYLLSGGKALSWEWLTDVKPCESWRYDAVGKPLWSKASGWTRFERLDDGRTLGDRAPTSRPHPRGRRRAHRASAKPASWRTHRASVRCARTRRSGAATCVFSLARSSVTESRMLRCCSRRRALSSALPPEPNILSKTTWGLISIGSGRVGEDQEMVLVYTQL